MGDFNYPDINWTTSTASSSNSLEFIEQTRDAFLFQHVQSPTRAREGHQSNILDLILTNESTMIQK